MPAFTFEKISPPVPRALHHPEPSAPTVRPLARAVTQQREAMVQVLGRFVEARIRPEDRGLAPPPRQPLPK